MACSPSAWLRWAGWSLPDVATVGEQGVSGFEAVVWLAVAAPAGIPDSITRKLSAAIASATVDPAVRALIQAQGYEPSSDGAKDIAQRIQADSEKWSRIIKEAGITLE